MVSAGVGVGAKCLPLGEEGEPLRQVFHRQLLLQVPVLWDRHILIGGSHERDGPAVVLRLGRFFLHVDLMAVLLRGKPGAAAAVDLFHGAAHVVVADVQHAAGGAGVDHGGAVQEGEVALCQGCLVAGIKCSVTES